MAETWPIVDEINTCNGDFIMAIIEVIVVGNKIPIKDYLNLLIDLSGLSLSNIDLKNYHKREMCPLSFWSPADSAEERRGR